MSTVLLYLLKANLVISIFFLAYYCLLRKEKFFRLNRIVLLSAIGLAFLLPLLPSIENATESRLGRSMSNFSPFSYWEQPFSMAPDTATASKPAQAPVSIRLSKNTTFSISHVVNILGWVYFLIAAVLLLRLLFQIQQVGRIIRRSKCEKMNGIVYCYHEQDLPVFSFFHYLVMNREQYPPAEIDQVIAHEHVHIRQVHNFDLLLVEVVHALFWINPLFIGFKQAVKLNLEFIADKVVLDSGADHTAYQYSMLRYLRPSGLPLVNLFASSKIKTRILMMNKKNSPVSNLYKYTLVLPLLAGSYFIVNPLKARSTPLSSSREAPLPARQDLKAFEGYYQSDFNRDIHIQIRASGDQLILTELVDNSEVVFDQQSAMEFSTLDKKFPLKFFKNDQGAVVQVLAFNRNRWNKVTNYAPPKYIRLQPEALKPFEGYYQNKRDDGKMMYLQIESISDGLLLRQGWDGREMKFIPRSATAFLGRNGTFSLEFTKDDNGNVTQVLAIHRDLWKKMQDPYAAVIKREIKLEPAQLKALEGEYQMKNGNKISIKVESEGLALKQLWDNEVIHLVPSSSTGFFSKERSMALVFKTKKNGVATEFMVGEKDRWTKIKE
jgi:beta-lactamase regulating signal transducer with metallopeptidase domain